MATVVAFAVILDDESRLLLCRRKKDSKWNLPGGKLNAKEAPWDAVVREVCEEVGLDIQVERLLGIYAVPKDDELVLTFACSSSAPTPHASGEIDAVEYFEFSRLPANLREHHAARALDALTSDYVILRDQPATPSAHPNP